MIVALDDPPADGVSSLNERINGNEGKRRGQLRGCAAALLLCMLVTLAGRWLLPAVDSVNLVMVYLLAVVIVALRYGRWPSVVATLLNIAAFDLVLSRQPARWWCQTCSIW